MINTEELHQKIVELEKAKQKENELRSESEKLLESLHKLAVYTDEKELLSGIKTELKKILNFENMIILKLEDENRLRAVDATLEKNIASKWGINSLFSRVLNGNPAAVFDISQINEWQGQPEEIRAGVKSALHFALKGLKQTFFIICTHGETGFYTRRHIQLIKRFMVFISQFLVNIEMQKTIVERDRFFTLSLDMMCIIGFDGYFKLLNSRWEETTGYENSYLMSKPVETFIHREDRDATLSKVSSIIGHGASDRFENRFLCSDGKYKNIVWKAASFVEGKMLYAVATDITKRKEAELELIHRNEIMERDLLIARGIQNTLFGKDIPGDDRLAIKYRYFPLDVVGGDFFSFTELEEGGIGLFIGDVSGHGVSAALFLSLIKFSTDEICRTYAHSPQRYIEKLNMDLFRNMPMTFMTAIYGYFQFNDDSDTVKFIFSRGGHPYPLLYDSETGRVKFLKSKGKMIGVKDNAIFDETTLVLKPGDRIFFYTDGISEIRNANNELISDDEFSAVFEKACSSQLDATLDIVLEELNLFQDERQYEDDVVLIGIEIKKRT